MSIIQHSKFHKTAETNATNVGLNKQIRKTDGELNTEINPQDKLSIGQHIDAGQKTGIAQDMGKTTTGVSDEEPETDGTDDQETTTQQDSSPKPTTQEMLTKLSGGGQINPYLQQLVNSGKLSNDDLQKLIDLNSQRRDQEQMMIQADQKEREAMKNTQMNMWIEAQTNEKQRMQQFLAFMDAMAQTDAAIAATRTKRVRAVADIMYAALLGDYNK